MDIVEIVRLVAPWIVRRAMNDFNIKELLLISRISKFFRTSVLITLELLHEKTNPLLLAMDRPHLSSLAIVTEYRSSNVKELVEKGDASKIPSGPVLTWYLVDLFRFIKYNKSSIPMDVKERHLYKWTDPEIEVSTVVLPAEALMRSLIETTRSKVVYNVVMTLKTYDVTVSLLKMLCPNLQLKTTGTKETLLGRVHAWLITEIDDILQSSMGLPVLEPAVLQWYSATTSAQTK